MNKQEMMTGVVEILKNGHGRAKIDGLDDDSYFVYCDNLGKSLNLDKVELIVVNRKGRNEVVIKKVIERNRKRFAGVVKFKQGSFYFHADNKNIHVPFLLDDSTCKEGDKIIVDFVDWCKNDELPTCILHKKLGRIGDNETEMNAIMYEFDLPSEFEPDILIECDDINDDITQSEIDRRLDLRDWITIGIDPFDSKDADDTLSIKKEGDDLIVSINIADVSYYLKHGTATEREAYKRGTSVYLVDRCIPMLPEKLSNDICSLKSGQDKLTVSAKFKFNKDGLIVNKWFGRTIINVNRDLSYEEAQTIIENNDYSDDIEESVLLLNNISKKLRKDRIEAGSIEMNSIEVKFNLASDSKKPVGVYTKVSKDSNKLIEEFMLLANKEVSKFNKSKGTSVNRIHDDPDSYKIESIQRFALAMGFSYDNKIDVRTALIKLLKEIKNTPEENIINTLVIRSQQKAQYSTHDIGHFGLNFDDYSHFTSPIRRYSDYLTHLLLLDGLGNDGYIK